MTIVKRVVVGAPIRSINLPGTTLRGLFDVDVDSNRVDGDLLSWDLVAGKWRNKPAGLFFDSAINALSVRIDGNDSDITTLYANDASFTTQFQLVESDLTRFANRLDSQRIDYIWRDHLLLEQIDSNERMQKSDDLLLSGRIDSNYSLLQTIRISLLGADSDINDRIDSNYSLLQSIRGNLQFQIDSNEVLLQSIRVNLQGQIDSNEVLLQSIRGNLQFQIDSNEVLLQSIRANLQSQMDSNETMSRNADTQLGLRIDSNYSVFNTTKNSLQAQIDSNESMSRTADINLGLRIDSNYSVLLAVQNMLNASDSAIGARIDSNYDLLQSIRANLQGQIDSNEVLFDGRLDSDLLARIAADNALGLRIDSNYTLLQNIRNALLAADSALGGRIDSDYLYFTSVDSNLADRIDSNYTLTQSIRANLQGQIDSNEVLLQSIRGNLQGQIDSNEVLLQSIRANLQGQIDSNEVAFNLQVAALENADSVFDARIDSNYTLLQNIRGNLQGQIDSNEVLLQSIRGNLQGQIDSNETMSRAADIALGARIDSNYTRLITLTTTNVAEGSNLYFTNERVDDRVAALLQNGSNISLVYNDAGNTLTISATFDSVETNALISAALVPIQNQINSDGTDIITLKGQVISLQSQINSDGNDIITLKGQYTSLQSQINSDGADIVTIKGQITTLQNTDTSLQNQINSDGADIASLRNRVTTLENSPGVDSAAVFALVDQRIDSNDFVKLVGDQSIGGIKTFNDSAFFGGGQVLVTPTAIRVGTGNFTQSAQWGTLALQGNRGGNIEFRDSVGALVFDIYPYNDSGYTGINTYGSRTLYLDAARDLNLAATNEVLLRTAGSLRMTVNTSGNVGIGGTPANVTGYTVLTLNNATNGGNIRLRNNGTTIGSIANTVDRMIIGTDVTTAFTAIQSGNVTRMNFAGNETRIAIGRSNTLADSDAILDIVSTTKGILIPRMTTAQRNAIAAPVPTGLIVYDTTTNKLSRRGSSTWDYLTVDSDLHERGLTGGGNDKVFLVYSNRVTTSYTIDSNSNALTAGPITIDSGATVTIPVGSTWTIL